MTDEITPKPSLEHTLNQISKMERKNLNKSASEKQIGGDHYKKYKIQPGHFCEINGLDIYEASAIKYIVRHQDKGGVIDIDKAIHCLELIKEIKYPDESPRQDDLFDSLENKLSFDNGEL